MARRPTNQSDGSGVVDRSTAESVVMDNFGSDELDTGDDGVDDLEDELELGDGGQDAGQPDLGDDDDEPGDADDPFNLSQYEEPDRGQPDRVSHTKKSLPRRSEVKPDKRGNLLDKDGKIVARAGREARLYQGRERYKRQLSSAQSETTEVRGQLQKLAGVARTLYNENTAYKAQGEALKQFNLTPQKQLTALQLFAELESNPQQAIRRILTQAAARGINVQELGNANGGTDVAALSDLIKREIGAAIDPLKKTAAQQEQERQERQQLETQNQEAAREVRAFFGRNPEAKNYAQVFTRALNDPRYSGFSLGEIWAKILQNLPANRGRQRSRTPGTGSLPRGRGMAPTGNSGIAHPTTSYDAIIDQSLAEAGRPRSNNRV